MNRLMKTNGFRLERKEGDPTQDEEAKKKAAEEAAAEEEKAKKEQEEIDKLEKEIEELRSELEDAKAKKEAGQEPDEKQMARIAKLTNAYEAKAGAQSRLLTLQMLATNKKNAELEDRIKDFEVKLAKASFGGDINAAKASPEYKAFFAGVRKGFDKLNDAEKKALNTLNNVEGGYLCPPEFVQEIIKKVTEISMIRTVARVRTTSAKQVEIPTREALAKAYWTPELAKMQEDNSKYGKLIITPQKMTAVIPVSTEMLEDSAFDMENEILQDASERFAQTEGAAFVTGDGVEKPFGFLHNPRVPTYQADQENVTAGAFGGDDLIKMGGLLKTAYANQAVYGLNRKTLTEVMILKDDMGRYIWQSGLAAGKPDTIAGRPYIEIPDMEDIGVGKRPVVLADWARFYCVVDRVDVTIIRDPYTLAKLGMVEFTVTKRVGGDVVLPEAGVVMVTKA